MHPSGISPTYYWNMGTLQASEVCPQNTQDGKTCVHDLIKELSKKKPLVPRVEYGNLLFVQNTGYCKFYCFPQSKSQSVLLNSVSRKALYHHSRMCYHFFFESKEKKCESIFTLFFWFLCFQKQSKARSVFQCN